MFYDFIQNVIFVMSFLDRWVDFAHSKSNETVATFTSGALVAGGIDDSLTLADWSTILGIAYLITMLIPRLYKFIKWTMRKRKNRKR